MLKTCFLFLITALAALAADPWVKVTELKSGTELRIYKKGSSKPLLASMDEANQTRLLAATKNEQIAIDKADIDRIDARPTRAGGRTVKEARSVIKDPGPNPNPALGSKEPQVPTSSESTHYTFQGKPDFETVYRRQPEGRK